MTTIPSRISRSALILLLVTSAPFTSGCQGTPEESESTLSQVEACVEVIGQRSIPSGSAEILSDEILLRSGGSAERTQLALQVTLDSAGRGCGKWNWVAKKIKISEIPWLGHLELTLSDGSVSYGSVVSYDPETFKAKLVFNLDDTHPVDPGYFALARADLNSALAWLSPAARGKSRRESDVRHKAPPGEAGAPGDTAAPLPSSARAL